MNDRICLCRPEFRKGGGREGGVNNDDDGKFQIADTDGREAVEVRSVLQTRAARRSAGLVYCAQQGL